jgi:hypothetical protein
MADHAHYKLTRHTLHRTPLGWVHADFLHRASGASAFLRAFLKYRGEERFTPALRRALHQSLHPSKAGKARQVNPMDVQTFQRRSDCARAGTM